MLTYLKLTGLPRALLVNFNVLVLKTGVKSFIVGPAGVVFAKDLGADTLEQFKAMKQYNPDPSWSPVQTQE